MLSLYGSSVFPSAYMTFHDTCMTLARYAFACTQMTGSVWWDLCVYRRHTQPHIYTQFFPLQMCYNTIHFLFVIYKPDLINSWKKFVLFFFHLPPFLVSVSLCVLLILSLSLENGKLVSKCEITHRVEWPVESWGIIHFQNSETKIVVIVNGWPLKRERRRERECVCEW